MHQIRRSDDRGHFDHGWLDTRHTFSFGEYRDPRWNRFRALRVMNEDRVAPGAGFGSHPHRDMEIVTYVLAGALEHKDSMGNGEVLRPGEFQRMSAGSGILHSEFNPSADEPAHFYQIWLLPREKGVEPSYEQKRFDEAERKNRLRLVASPDGAEGSLTINQDARVYLSTLDEGAAVTHDPADGRHAWLQVLRGGVEIAGESLEAGDGIGVSERRSIEVRGAADAEVLLFDLA